MTTGERIRKYRKEKHLTQKRLGELAEIAEPTIRRYELGKLNPKYETLLKIASALEIPVAFLLGHGLTSWNGTYIEEEPDWEGLAEEAKRQALFKIVTLFNTLNADGQDKAVRAIEKIAANPKNLLQSIIHEKEETAPSAPNTEGGNNAE